MTNFEPWSRSSASGDARLTRLFASVGEPEPLPELERQRVLRRLQDRGQRRAASMLLRLVAGGVVLGVAGAAAAQWTAQRWLTVDRAAETSVAAPTSTALAPQPVLPARPRASFEVAEPQLPPVEPALPPAVTAPPPPSAPSAPGSRLGLEASSLQVAVTALRGGAPEAALTTLDRHLRRFPGGALELEARVARVDALLLLGRREEGRRDLARLPLQQVGRGKELRLIRAELEAERDCGRALSDFGILTAQSLPAAWAERALFGRGACLLKLGDEAGAARDFALYLERFPNGRFAEQVRARLPRGP